RPASSVPSHTWRPTVMSRRHLFAALFLGAMATSLVSCNSGSTSPATSPIDLSPPQAPTNLRVTDDTSINRDWLIWDASASASVSSYQVYSATTPSGTGTLIGTFDASTTDYLLPISSTDATEFYRVRAVGTNSVPSAFTSTLSVDARAGTSPRPRPAPARAARATSDPLPGVVQRTNTTRESAWRAPLTSRRKYRPAGRRRL